MPNDVYEQQVKDVMSREVVMIDARESIHEAIELMAENKVATLPVIDRDGRCIGMLSTSDMVEVTRDVDAGLLEMENASQLLWGDYIEKLGNHVGHQNVMELMSENVVSVRPDSALADAAARMVREHIHRIPVVDDSDRVVGIVSTTDILGAFVKCAPAAAK